MLELLTDPQVWIAFTTLTLLELVLGIDNIIFISILVDKLPLHLRERTRRIGLFLAMFMRIGLLLLLAWLVGLTAPLFTVLHQEISGRDLILIGGGVFLLWKSVGEIHQLMEGGEGQAASGSRASFTAVILQIIVIDMVFSLDSIITAVGMVEQVSVMIAAVVASVGLMMLFAGPIGRFVSAHPTVKMLALAFLVLIGVVLVAEGLGHHLPKAYIYSAMAFAAISEMLNLRIRKRTAQVGRIPESYNGEHRRSADLPAAATGVSHSMAKTKLEN
ncbi:TerC family protein [soil metagenome]